MSSKLLRFCTACTLLGGATVRAANGDLDTTFAPPFGYATEAFDLGGNNTDTVESILIQPGGGIVLVGTATIDAGTTEVAITRLLPDGTLDSNFGTGGRTHASVGPSDLQPSVSGAALDANGSIYVAGYGYSSYYYSFIGHFLSNGALDTSFATSGFNVSTSPYPYFFRNVAVDSNEKPVVVGSVFDGGTQVLAIRYTTAGQIDPVFNSGQPFIQTIGTGSGPYDSAWSVTFDRSGRIYLGAEAGTGGGSFQLESLAMMRLTAAGLIDATCNGNGVVPFVGFSNIYLQPESILFRDTHHVILIGSQGPAGYLYAADFDADDCTAGSGPGTILSSIAPNSGQAAVASDGSVYVSYSSTASSPITSQILTLHNGLQYTGQPFTAYPSTTSLGVGIVLSGGRPLQAIQQQVSGSNYDFAVARFQNDRIFYANFDRDAPN